ncbi:hypothetical protein NBRC116590_35220 [Pelagimonas sp. KU-00592-HH]|uniref:DUF1963 domain-containing protein n=1 Tax=Pelagimonas sp. KU-00592-HH TaxID=3127651 RepID=UPI0031065803
MFDRFFEGLKVLGGVALACGVLWAGVSMPKPGWSSLRAMLPEWTVNFEAAIVLILIGAVAIFLGHRMSARRALGQKAAAPPDMFSNDPATRALWDRIGKEQLAAEKQAVGDVFGRAQRRIALRPCWPQRETKSWIGGLPMLPVDMDWPRIEGKPAVFIAQICLADMPDDLWQGAGPRDGWLVIWGDEEGGCGTALRHVSGALQERAQPDGVAPCWHWNMEPCGMQSALGTEGLVPLRWYLEPAEDASLGAVEDMMADNPAFWDDDAGDWIWASSWLGVRHDVMRDLDVKDAFGHGLDWRGLFGLLGIWRRVVTEEREQVRRELESRDARLERLRDAQGKELRLLEENPGAEAASFAQMKLKHQQAEARLSDQFSRLEQDLTRMDQALVLAGRIETEVRGFEDDVPFAAEIGHEVLDTLNDAFPAPSAHMRPAVQHFVENYARYCYVRHPSDLSDALFDRFAPLWERQCRDTLIFVGCNHDGTVGMQPDARLIDVPSHPLAGLSFGDDSRFYVDMRLRDLVSENWHEAEGLTTHGAV